MTPERPSTGDPELDSVLKGIEQAAEMDAAANARVMDNHLLHSDRVIANQAALQTIRDGNLSRLAEIAVNPT